MGRRHGPMSGNYIALSWCWGNSSNKPEIFVDNQSLQVPRNLEAALRRLRELEVFKKGLWMWIDAICINQTDKDEVESQLKTKWLAVSARHAFLAKG